MTFICTVGEEQVETLRTEVGKILDYDEDSVFIVRQCKTCWGSLVTLGQGEPPREELFWEAW
ncbi:hypothetical protein ACIGKQ_22240 [Gordonia sp. NPDC062954]|uniref:hypothetical protein n=1 Tax=Gordonia sp. NPDC062954 TaxID=3364003 RepID=UPI0037C51FAA